MRNWSVDTSRFEKNSREYEIWQLEQLLNLGLPEGETLDLNNIDKRAIENYFLQLAKELDIIK